MIVPRWRKRKPDGKKKSLSPNNQAGTEPPPPSPLAEKEEKQHTLWSGPMYTGRKVYFIPGGNEHERKWGVQTPDGGKGNPEKSGLSSTCAFSK